MTAHHTITDRDPDQSALTDAGAVRSCPVCGSSFTPSPRKPGHTYCRERCRATAWRHRRRDAAHRDAARRVAELTAHHPTTASPMTNTPTSGGRPVMNDVTNEDGTHSAANEDANEDLNAATAVQHCPHCHQPIAVITLILSPAAAHVTVPTPPPIPPTRRGRHG